MNLTEQTRSEFLIKRLVSMPMKTRTSEEATFDWQSVNWQSCAAGLAMLAFGYRLFRALKRKMQTSKCAAMVSLRRSKRISRRNEVSSSSTESIGSVEVCPICLEPPRVGVRTGCDHRMCAACLRRYCEIHAADHKRNRPPPCPLCRTPLVAVTLMYSQINNDAIDTETAAWIDEFNETCGRPANKTGFLANNALIKLLLATLLFCAVARFQGIDWLVYSSFFVTAFGMTLMSCLWLMCHEEAIPDDYDDDGEF